MDPSGKKNDWKKGECYKKSIYSFVKESIE